MKKRIINIMPFFDARRYSEKNRYGFKKKYFDLTKSELLLLERFSNLDNDSLSYSDRHDYLKLCIKKAIYCAVNEGKTYVDFVIPFPVTEIVCEWIKTQGYYLCPTPVDCSYYYFDDAGCFRYHQAKKTDPKTNCNYRVLW